MYVLEIDYLKINNLCGVWYTCC